MKHHVFSSDEEGHQNGVSKSSFWWWRANEEFDEDGGWRGGGGGELSPRIRVLGEMERLGVIGGEGVDELRHRVLSYRAGDLWMPIGGIKREESDVPPVITVLLTGLVASGKSSFINLMYSVLGRSGFIPFAQISAGESRKSTTMYLEEHNILRSPRAGLCVYDSMGLDPGQLDRGLDQVATWMSEGVRHNQPCAMSSVDLEKVKGPPRWTMSSSSSRYMRRKVNCVMVVADLSQVHRAFRGGDMKSMEALRALFHLPAIKNSNLINHHLSDENPILILTHGDTLNPQDRLTGRLTICEYLGIPETTGAYDIPCLTRFAEESDPVTAFALTEAVYRALLQSDRAHLPKKKLKEWIMLILSWIMLRIAAFFAALAAFFSKFEHHHNNLKM